MEWSEAVLSMRCSKQVPEVLQSLVMSVQGCDVETGGLKRGFIV